MSKWLLTNNNIFFLLPFLSWSLLNLYHNGEECEMAGSKNASTALWEFYLVSSSCLYVKTINVTLLYTCYNNRVLHLCVIYTVAIVSIMTVNHNSVSYSVCYSVWRLMKYNKRKMSSKARQYITVSLVCTVDVFRSVLHIVLRSNTVQN